MLSPPAAPPDGAQPHAHLPASSTAASLLPTYPAAVPGTSHPPAAEVAAPAGPGRPARPAGRRGAGAQAVAGAAAAPNGGGGKNGGQDVDGDDDSASLESGLQQEPDPLYDDAADEHDAAWADRQRGGRVSDAVLSCPGCFTMLCIDCQRHEKYHQQYRAMFVMNCSVDEEEPGEDGGGGAGGGGGDFDPAAAATAASAGGRGGRRPKRAKASAQYRRVTCGVCGTEVGALEVEEELYHFYHVFPSNA